MSLKYDNRAHLDEPLMVTMCSDGTTNSHPRNPEATTETAHFPGEILMFVRCKRNLIFPLDHSIF